MISIAPLWRFSLFWGWLGALSLLGAISCTAPLLKTLGYEFALAVSLAASLGAGHLAACYPGRIRAQLSPFPGARLPALVMYRRALLPGVLLLVPPLAISLLNGLRQEQCNISQGVIFYLLLPLPAVAAATAAGLTAGLVAPGPRSGSAIWFAAFAASLYFAFDRFHSTPAVYAFGPFFGYFPGVLYDRLVEVEPRLITYRVSTLVQTGAVLAALSWLIDPASLRLSLKRVVTRPRAAISTLVLTAAAASLYAAGPSLRHRTTRQELEKILPYKISTDKLDIFFPQGIDNRTAESMASDAEFSLDRIESFLKERTVSKISVFAFQSASQKAAAMGASGTNVTKPWRSEIYVTVDELPHEVLRHELVHAVAAKFGRGPFAIAGGFGGLWPDPGLIEGLASAAQGPRGDLTLHQWSAAMKRLKILPSLKKIFGLGFLDLASSTAYTAAGSFLGWLHKQSGAEALKKLYSGASWKNATGKSLQELSEGWLRFLDGVKLDEPDLAAARHRFDRPSVIRSVCVHEVARLSEQADQLLRRGMWNEAILALESADKKSGGSAETRLDLFYAKVDMQKTGEVESMAKELLADKSINSAIKSEVREILADAAARSGRAEFARAEFEALSSIAPTESDRRRLEVKSILASLPISVTGETVAILSARRGPDRLSEPLAALAIATAADEMPDNPVLAYLLARQYFNYRDWEKTLSVLDKAEGLGLAQTTESIRLEARMMRGKSLFALGRFKEAEILFSALAADASLRDGAREQAADWAERCAFMNRLRGAKEMR